MRNINFKYYYYYDRRLVGSFSSEASQTHDFCCGHFVMKSWMNLIIIHDFAPRFFRVVASRLDDNI